MADQDAVAYSVFDGDTDNGIAPGRPTLGNLGGGEFVNDPFAPPDPEVFLDADAENQKEKVLYGLAQMGFALGFEVAFSGGTPSISAFANLGTRLEISDLTVTDNGAGDTTIAWPASYLVPSGLGPLVTITEDVDIDRVNAVMANDRLSVRVKTKLSTTGTDAGFSCYIHGA